MRAALWLVALFAVAVATALLAGNNQGTVTLFWMPYRVDLSINMVALLWVLSFAFMHLALRALAALFELPSRRAAGACCKKSEPSTLPCSTAWPR